MSYLQVGKSLTLPCGIMVKNRFFKSAMSETFADNDHQPNALHVNLYRKWANGGAGIVVTGNVMVDHHAMAEPGNVVIEDDRSLPILKKWAEAGTQNNTQLWLQLNHPGKQSPRIFSEQPVAPSAIPTDLWAFKFTVRLATWLISFSHVRTIVERMNMVGHWKTGCAFWLKFMRVFVKAAGRNLQFL